MAPERLHLRPAHTLSGPIRQAFEAERAKILSLLPHAEVLHTGATSVPDALTRGDLDMHVRVSPADFSSARDKLAGSYAAYRPEMWTAGFAAFVAPDASIPTGIAVTAIGGEHDRRFVLAWERLRRDPELLEAHNALKLKYENDLDVGSYEAAKSAFFSALVAGEQPRST